MRINPAINKQRPQNIFRASLPATAKNGLQRHQSKALHIKLEKK